MMCELSYPLTKRDVYSIYALDLLSTYWKGSLIMAQYISIHFRRESKVLMVVRPGDAPQTQPNNIKYRGLPENKNIKSSRFVTKGEMSGTFMKSSCFAPSEYNRCGQEGQVFPIKCCEGKLKVSLTGCKFLKMVTFVRKNESVITLFLFFTGQ